MTRPTYLVVKCWWIKMPAKLVFFFASSPPYRYLNLCGSSVSLEAVKEVLANCPHINAINLASCRGLPRGVKRLLQGAQEIAELRENLGVTLKCAPRGAQSALAPSSPTDT